MLRVMPMLVNPKVRALPLLLLALLWAGTGVADHDAHVGGSHFGPFRGGVGAGPCPHITHTQMRSLKIDGKIAIGMSRDEVRDSWGDPSSVALSSDGSGRWVFRWSDGSLDAVYFAGGCVQSWASHSP